MIATTTEASTMIGERPKVNRSRRTVTGVCVPYGETSYLTPNPSGEVVLRGAFADAVTRPESIFLFRSHDHSRPVGKCIALTEQADGLHGTFQIRDGAIGDEVLEDIRQGYLPAMSVGFRATQTRRGPSGEVIVVKGILKEVSVLPIGAYDGAKVLAMRRARLTTSGTRPPATGTYWHVAASLRGVLPAGALVCTPATPCQQHRTRHGYRP